MRNLAQYPLTNEDRLAVLKRLREKVACELTEMPVGDLTLVVLDDLIAGIGSENGG